MPVRRVGEDGLEVGDVRRQLLEVDEQGGEAAEVEASAGAGAAQKEIAVKKAAAKYDLFQRGRL